MPIYEFVCKKCCCHFEALVRMGAEKDVVCPDCGSAEIEKLFSSFGIGGGSSRLTASSASSSGSSSCTSCASKSCSSCR